MRVENHQDAGRTVVTLVGDLDGSVAPQTLQEIVALIPERGPMTLDMTGVPYMSSAGIRTVMMVYRQAQTTETPVTLLGLNAELEEVLSATGLLRFFTVEQPATEVSGG